MEWIDLIGVVEHARHPLRIVIGRLGVTHSKHLSRLGDQLPDVARHPPVGNSGTVRFDLFASTRFPTLA
jgi:hypothetical protein